MKNLNEDLQRMILYSAYRVVKLDGWPPGIDEMTFEQIEKKGVNEFIEGIIKELNGKTYKSGSFKSIAIPGPDGKSCNVLVPTIKDRIVFLYNQIWDNPASYFPSVFRNEFQNHNEHGSR